MRTRPPQAQRPPDESDQVIVDEFASAVGVLGVQQIRQHRADSRERMKYPFLGVVQSCTQLGPQIKRGVGHHKGAGMVIAAMVAVVTHQIGAPLRRAWHPPIR